MQLGEGRDMMARGAMMGPGVMFRVYGVLTGACGSGREGSRGVGNCVIRGR